MIIVRWNKDLQQLVLDMEKSLEAITKWLRQPGLKVNDSKTGRMLKAPPLISLDLHISVFQDKSERGALHMYKNMFEKALK